ncbi:hypothetical protein FHL15_005302 [Xylaria flabelliformis]|uniref:Uncharacterized protein n=1 Tax=Xylaria flabelliformis TaxID=2512241 RepID=A0A553I143_9PEZI|nr:hypothetical protein FHL15_005302 [Xylaria flabelliformis]
MCLLLEVMCPKTKCKSKTSSKKTSKKEKCQECITRRIAREELNQMHLPPGMMPVTYQHQPGYDYSYSYGYGDWSTLGDNYPAVISNKRWRDHTQTAQNTYESAQENGKKIGEVKNAITTEIKEAQKAIKETHASVANAVSYAKGTHVAVNEARLAIQDTISDKHAEHMSKQEECAADIAKVRQLLEEEARQREETRRLQEMVRYAQSQGLLQTPPARDRDHRSRSSRSSSPATSASTSSNGTRGNGRTRADEERVAEKERQWEREKEQLEQQYTKAMHDMANTQQQLQRERERWSKTEGELEYLRRRDAYFHHPRFQGAHYDDIIEASPYNPYPYADYGVRGGAGHRGSRGHSPRCGNARSWDY